MTFCQDKRMDNSNPHEIIPISFDMQAILKDRYYNIGMDSRYLIQMWSQASGIKLPEVHRVDKGVDPNVKPERQILKSPNLATQPNWISPDYEKVEWILEEKWKPLYMHNYKYNLER